MTTHSTILKNTSFLFVGRLLTLVLSIIYYGTLSRYVHASGMGVLGTATSLISLLITFVNFGLNELIVRDVAADKSRSASYVANVLFLRAGLSIVFFGAIFALIKLIKYPIETSLIILLYGFCFIFDSFSDVYLSIFNAHEKMEYVSLLFAGRDIINISLSLAAIALKSNLYLIVGISAFASFIKLIAANILLKTRFVTPRWSINLPLIRRILLTSLPFAALSIINALHQSVDTFILSFYRPAQVVGWYSSVKIFLSYLLLLPNYLNQAIFPVFSRLHVLSYDELKRIYSVFFKYLLLFGCVVCFGILVIADRLIVLMFGPDFKEASIILQILSFSFLWIFGYVNGAVLLATGGQKIFTKLSFIGLVLTIIVSLLITPKLGMLGPAISFILPGAIFALPLTWICHRRLRLPIPYILMIKSLAAGLSMATISVIGVKLHLPFLIIVFVLAPCVYGLLLGILGLISRQEFRLVIQLVKNKIKISSR